MTAACTFEKGATDGDVIHCACPVYEGPYDVASGESCEIRSRTAQTYIWSSARLVSQQG